MSDLDLFGKPIVGPINDTPLRPIKKPRKPTKKNGYAARPGSGPKDKTCKTCIFKTGRTNGGKVYIKCYLTRASWTGGPGSDILAGAAACKFYQEFPTDLIKAHKEKCRLSRILHDNGTVYGSAEWKAWSAADDAFEALQKKYLAELEAKSLNALKEKP